MTPAEVMHTIRTVLDDGLFRYLGFAEINRRINQAQMQMIDKYHGLDDERALRPLYVYDTGVANGGTLSRDLLYPRAARIFENDEDVDFDSWVAEYLTYNVFINYTSPGIVYATSMPRSAYWTYYKVMNTLVTPNQFETRVRFSRGSDTALCNVLYIATPLPFDYQVNRLNSQGNPPVGLSVPEEYHLEIALLAAELANNIDVGERERGEVAIEQMGQRVTLQNAGG